jgi:hypothetical protein
MLMTLDGQHEPTDSDCETHDDDGKPRNFATITASITDVPADGDRWRKSAHCTERERRARWPLG